MNDEECGEVCSLIGLWRRINGGGRVVLAITDRVRLLEYNVSLKPFLAKRGYVVVDGYVCREARWKRT